MSKKISKVGNTLHRDLGGGRILSVTETPAGTRAAIHQGGTTTAVAPGDYGVAGVKTSSVGGGAPRVTVKGSDGIATDYTQTSKGSVDVRQHHDGTSKPKKD
jgi:hypothetical protein